jgi:CubicO group peptidase (beta-lactamase class C family)
VLARTSLEEMWRGVRPLGATSADSIGLGFFIVNKGGVRLIGHTGSQKAFRSFVYIDPVTQAGVVLVMNTAPAEQTSNPTNRVPGSPRIGVILSGVLDRVVGLMRR